MNLTNKYYLLRISFLYTLCAFFHFFFTFFPARFHLRIRLYVLDNEVEIFLTSSSCYHVCKVSVIVVRTIAQITFSRSYIFTIKEAEV